MVTVNLETAQTLKERRKSQCEMKLEKYSVASISIPYVIIFDEAIA